MTPDDPRTVDGRVPGRRGLATRQRLLDVTGAQLDARPYREVRVVDIAREAGTSPATFYQYFPDVEAAVLALAEALADDGGRHLRALVVTAPWDTDPAAAARCVADGYLAFFEQHRALLSVIDLAALDGDKRFRTLRTRLLNGAAVALAEVARAFDAGTAPDPLALAGVLSSMLTHVSAHRRGLAEWGVAAPDLRDAMAAVVRWSLTGR